MVVTKIVHPISILVAYFQYITFKMQSFKMDIYSVCNLYFYRILRNPNKNQSIKSELPDQNESNYRLYLHLCSPLTNESETEKIT